MSTETLTFRAMGCTIRVHGADADTREAARRLFVSRERALSRFDPDSELSRINAVPGRDVAVSPTLAQALADALRAFRVSDGLVDPTLERALVAAGYGADLELLPLTPTPDGAPESQRGRGADVRLDGRLLRRPPGVRLDLAGVVKGRTVDEALALLPSPAFVSAGGDVATRGALTVTLPAGGAIRLRAGGIATSGTTRRRWTSGGGAAHHLIDPRTGRPSTSRWEAVTVAAGSCLAADVAAKTAFLLSADGPDWLEARGLVGRFVETGGAIVETRTWHEAVAA